jgi:HPt (histidine-containing phosphotransfer) domain-containing protein
MGDFTDLGFLKTFTGGDAAKMKKYITMFTGSAPGILDKINADCGSSDWKALKTSSHSLKTQLKYMGAEKAQAVAYEIEQLSEKQERTGDIPELVKTLDELTRGVVTELNQELEKL